MKTERLLSILRILRTRHRISAKQIAGELGVSERTVYRDLLDLSASGVPINSFSGPGGGFFLSDRAHIDLGALSHEDLQSLFFPIGSLPQTEIGLNTDRSIEKLLSLASDQTRESIDRIRQRFFYDPGNWFQNIPIHDCLPLLRRAVLEDRVIRFIYGSIGNNSRERTVEAWALVVKVKTWYLIGREIGAHKKQFRTFRISRVRLCQVLPDIFLRDQAFYPEFFWKKITDTFEERAKGLSTETVVKVMAHKDIEWYFPSYMEERYFRLPTEDTDDWLCYELNFSSENLAKMQLMGLGSSLKVLSPLSLKEKIIKSAQSILQRYSGNPVDNDDFPTDPLKQDALTLPPLSQER